MPLLIIHGEKDELVPVAMGRRLLAANDAIKESRFIADAGHNDVWDRGGEEVVIDFIRRRLGS
ncbi:MAG: alpha/beta hydrolase [Magnetospirillum sp.]|nr:MAG: alpha/beta hydrolase [Magnetospirillum sp.]